MSMAFSLESRTPFLDHRLVEYSVSLPADLRLRRGLSKWILREAMKGVLPESVRLRPDKKGFAAPTALWLRGVLKEPVRQVFASRRFMERGYLNGDVVLSEFEAHCRGEKNLFGKIWSWLNLELWFRVFIDDPHFGTAKDAPSAHQ
jgi:asparagine synthase (glutamine-hydrolysing)